MQPTYRIQTVIVKDGKLSIKGLPFHSGESVVVTVRRPRKKANGKNKYPLRGKPFVYREPFKSVAADEWEAAR